MAQHMAIIRSMSTKEGDHGRATFLLRNGYLPQPPVRYPTLGSLVAKELGDPTAELPSFVSIAPFRNFNPAAFSPGFLGSQFAPLFVGEARNQNQGDDNNNSDEDLHVADLDAPSQVTTQTVSARLGLLNSLNDRFIGSHAGPPAIGYKTAYDRAVLLMRSKAAKAFDLDEESTDVRDAYGRNRFGQGCLLARRLVERGVPFVEVTLGRRRRHRLGHAPEQLRGRQTAQRHARPGLGHADERAQRRGDCWKPRRSSGWASSAARPRSIRNTGRDHYPNAWSTVLAGGGIRGGQVVGRTSADGTTVAERPVQRARLAGHGLQGAGHRSDEAEHLQRRPAHSRGRPVGQSRRGDRRMNRACGLGALLLAVVCGAGVAAARADEARGRASSAASDVEDVLFLGPMRPLFLRLHVIVDGKPFRDVWHGPLRRVVRAWRTASTTAA